MNKLKKILALGSTLVVTAGLAYYIGVSNADTTQVLGGDATETDGGEPKILYWRAPMDPNETYDSPGKSRMGMDLVPVYDDLPEREGGNGDESGIIKIDPVALQKVNFSTAAVSIERLNPTIRTTGRFVMERDRPHERLAKGGWLGPETACEL